jgi:hypothetical protein
MVELVDLEHLQPVLVDLVEEAVLAIEAREAVDTLAVAEVIRIRLAAMAEALT